MSDEYIEVFKMKGAIPLYHFIPFILLIASILILIYSCHKRIGVDIGLLLFGSVFFLISILACVLTCLTINYQLNGLYIPYKNGEYKVIEGEVKNLHLVKNSFSHDRDSFYINNVKFSYHGIEFLGPYQRIACDGGFIRENGQHVKIYYIPLKDDEGIKNHIVGLFVDSNELEEMKSKKN